MKLRFENIVNDPIIRMYIQKADDALAAIGYTEHGFGHIARTTETVRRIFDTLGYDSNLALIATYMHDIGNCINRNDHAQSGAMIAFTLLKQLGMDDEDILTVILAIGNHDEPTAYPVSKEAAALILADKSDVIYTRVRNKDIANLDIHDRVNHSVKKNKITITKETFKLDLTIDTDECSIMEYFEIFLERMKLCKQAAKTLNLEFELYVNGLKLS